VGNAQRFSPRKYVVKRLRILIVEDDAMVAMALAEMLADQQHEICGIATTESDAISAAARCKPDMMIIDVMLRAGSGVAALEAILRSGPIPYIIMSGAELESNAVMLRKPFREADLVRAMECALTATCPYIARSDERAGRVASAHRRA